MKYYIMTLIAILFSVGFTGCSISPQNVTAGSQSSEQGDDSLNTIASSTAWIAPYTLSKFHEPLDRSKLQYPDSTSVIENGAALQKENSQYFHVAGSGKMEFYQTGDHQRTELRDTNEWKTSTTASHWVAARLKIQSVSPDLEEVTMLQIHDSGTAPNKPLARIVWLKSKNDLSNHIWVVRRTSVTLDTYSYTDLGSPGTQYFTVNVSVINNKLTISYNDAVKVNNTDVSYWKSLDNYFKAGAYLQSVGYAYIRFDTLEFH